MANEEQLEILKSGVDGWNRWRKDQDRICLGGAAQLFEADLSNADLEDADLEGADLRRANLTGANLTNANLCSACLIDANLSGANLRTASLELAILNQADFTGANFLRAGLAGANLSGAILREADLTGANFSLTHLIRLDIRGANLRDAILGYTNLGVWLGEVSGLEDIEHRGPSAITPEALERAQGRLPDIFLKGIGLKDWEILNAKLHDPNLRPDEVTDIGYEIINLRTRGPIQVNTLFLSYARVDSDFVEFLEKKLDDDGIRSWRDLHDMVAGPVQSQIERAINLNGTVLLVLSKNSLGSDWVEWEVEKARGLQKKLEEEGKRDAHVLCPVAIDDAWKDSKWSGPLMNQLLKYNILDFSNWQDEEAVEKVYGKLKAGIAKYYSDFEDSV